MNIFSIAGVFEDQVHALAIIESNEDPHAWGDGDRAVGILQQHPAFFAQYYGHAKAFPGSASHTVTQAEIVAAATFFAQWIDNIKQDGTVSAYNTGITAYFKGVRNDDYVARWGKAFQDVRSGNHKCRLT